jgi:hypothetical protein
MNAPKGGIINPKKTIAVNVKIVVQNVKAHLIASNVKEQP